MIRGTLSENRIGALIILLLAMSVQLACIACPTGEQVQRRVVNSPAANGVLLAPDLSALNALMSSSAPPPGNVIGIPNGTKGRAVDRKFLRGRRLVDPYPANTYDMERDEAVEVVPFEVTEGPHRGTRGWVQSSFLRPDFNYL
jgi:hypothetical protein